MTKVTLAKHGGNESRRTELEVMNKVNEYSGEELSQELNFIVHT